MFLDYQDNPDDIASFLDELERMIAEYERDAYEWRWIRIHSYQPVVPVTISETPKRQLVIRAKRRFWRRMMPHSRWKETEE